MPRYEYICKGEGHEFEAKAGFDDAEIPCQGKVQYAVGKFRPCPNMAQRKEIQKVAGVIFSGGGFTRSST